jgi:hypothetical protein
METQYRIGDVVYDYYVHGKEIIQLSGIIADIRDGDYGIYVKWDSNVFSIFSENYNCDGSKYNYSEPTLSFTRPSVTLVVSGITLERPKEQFKEGDLVYGKDKGTDYWMVGIYDSLTENNYHKVCLSKDGSSYTYFDIVQKENPLI